MSDFRPYRISTPNWQLLSSTAFQSHHEIRIPGRDLKDPEVLTPHLLQNIGDSLQPGDQVNVCAFETVNWQRLTQFIQLRIVKKDREGIHFVRIGKIIDVPYEGDEKPIEVPPKAFVKRGYGATFSVFDEKDTHLEQFKTKKEAEEYAERINAGGM